MCIRDRCSSAKAELRERTWTVLEDKIPVKDDFRYLGAHIATPMMQGHNTSMADKRMNEAAQMARRLSCLFLPAAFIFYHVSLLLSPDENEKDRE